MKYLRLHGVIDVLGLRLAIASFAVLAPMFAFGEDLKQAPQNEGAGWYAHDPRQNVTGDGAMWNDSGLSGDRNSTSDFGNPSKDMSELAFTGPVTTRYSLELSKLPDSDGQFWVVYDIAPYTERFPNLVSPQDSIVDWILFDSGESFWRKEPFSVLNASRDRLYVYHSSSVQRYISNVVDRFVDPEKKSAQFSVKVVAIQSPDWRSRFSDLLSPLATTVVGVGADVQSWQTDHSGMAKVFAELEKRSDFILLNSGRDVVPNGETFGWAFASPRKEFNRDYRTDANSTTGYSVDVSSVDEGFRIEATPLLSTTGNTLELLVRYRSTVVEKTKTFSMRVPTSTSPRQQLNVEKPSIVSCDFSCKISSPRSKRVVVDLGLAPLTPPQKTAEQNGVLESVSGLLSQKSVFYDVIILVEEKTR